ncbi:MAG: transposase [Spirochaetota bacterium]|jgi:putative transposase
MPRKPRIQQENLTYHITSRCIEWRSMMDQDYFKQLLLETLAQAQKKYQFELNAYQIMDNHIHLVIRTLPGGASISRLVQYIKSRFAEKYNRLTQRIGPFWNERYHDSIIEHAENPEYYLLWLLWYLAFNPIRSKATDSPRKYKYSSIHSYLDTRDRPPVKVDLHQYFIRLGNGIEERIKRFLVYEDAYRRRLAVII